MRILLTGGSGMVGCNVLEAPAAAAHKVMAPGRGELDLLDPAAVARYVQTREPDLIIHCAGKVGGIQANIREPVAFLVENLDAGRNVVMSAMRAGVPRLINLASSCVYPGDLETPTCEEQIFSGAVDPSNEGYALAKIAVAQLCRYVGRERRDLSYKTLIPCNLYGRHDNFDAMSGHMIPAVIARLHLARQKDTAEAEIWGDGTARREFMYAGDLAGAIWRAVENFEALPDLLNIGLGYDHSIDEYYQVIAEIVGFTGCFTHDLSKPAGTRQRLMNVNRMKAWGFAPSHTLRDGIRLAYQYYLSRLAR
jgi:GDP-L-fucose synthase